MLDFKFYPVSLFKPYTLHKLRLLKKPLMLTKAVFIDQKCFLFTYNVMSFIPVMAKLNYSSLQCHMIFRNHLNVMICCLRNISDYQC